MRAVYAASPIVNHQYCCCCCCQRNLAFCQGPPPLENVGSVPTLGILNGLG